MAEDIRNALHKCVPLGLTAAVVGLGVAVALW